MLALILDRSDDNAPNQAARFTEHVRALKEQTLNKEERNDVLETFTVDSPIPYSIELLLARLDKDNSRWYLKREVQEQSKVLGIVSCLGLWEG